MANSQLYTQHPLDNSKQQIRLLRVRRSSAANVECHIEVYDIDKCLEYLAVSYVWCPPEPTATITIDGLLCTVR